MVSIIRGGYQTAGNSRRGSAFEFSDTTGFAFVNLGPLVSGIGVADSSGSGAFQLRAEGLEPRWSPSGERIAYLSRGSDPTGQYNLWVMNSDGSQPRQLTMGGVEEGFDWSPNGKEIAYAHFSVLDTSYTNGTIWIVDVDTLAKRQVTYNAPP